LGAALVTITTGSGCNGYECGRGRKKEEAERVLKVVLAVVGEAVAV